MIKIVKETLYEAYGAGFSQSSGFRGGMGGTSRGGFGGASNMGGPTMMYTYEIKPLNHALEQPQNSITNQIEEIKVGSIITGTPVKSNAWPDGKVKITGTVQKLVKDSNGEPKYYIVQDEATQNIVKIDYLTAQLNVSAPFMPYYNQEDSLRSRRKEKIDLHSKDKKFVKESQLFRELEPIDDSLNEGWREWVIGAVLLAIASGGIHLMNTRVERAIEKGIPVEVNIRPRKSEKFGIPKRVTYELNIDELQPEKIKVDPINKTITVNSPDISPVNLKMKARTELRKIDKNLAKLDVRHHRVRLNKEGR